MQTVYTIVYLPTGETIGQIQGEYSAKYVVRRLGQNYKFLPLVLDDPDILVRDELEMKRIS